MDFVAIDFETANEKRTSACSIGIVVVKNGVIVEKQHYLFKPIPNYFTNTWIHGIDANTVENESTFFDKWKEIKHHFKNNLVIAHNAAFDISVLRNIMIESGLRFPNLTYLCTYRMSQKVLPQLSNHKLSTIANHFNLKLNHHQALSDAEVCAQIALNLMKSEKCNDLIELSESLGFRLGKLKLDNEYDSFSIKKSRKLFYSYRENGEINIEVKSNKLENYKIVISGVFTKHTRSELKRLIEEHSGKNVSSISKNTTFVLAGDNMGPSKKEKAESLGISLVNEDEFLAKIS